MGAAGSPVAMETADVVLFSEDLGKLQDALVLGRACRAKILQNVAFSVALRALVTALAFLGMIGLVGAILGEVLGAMAVIANGMSVMGYGRRRRMGGAAAEGRRDEALDLGGRAPPLPLRHAQPGGDSQDAGRGRGAEPPREGSSGGAAGVN